MDEVLARLGRSAGPAEAGRAQNSGVQQAGAAVSRMDQAAQQNAALVEQSAAALQRAALTFSRQPCSSGSV